MMAMNTSRILNRNFGMAAIVARWEYCCKIAQLCTLVPHAFKRLDTRAGRGVIGSTASEHSIAEQTGEAAQRTRLPRERSAAARRGTGASCSRRSNDDGALHLLRQGSLTPVRSPAH